MGQGSRVIGSDQNKPSFMVQLFCQFSANGPGKLAEDVQTQYLNLDLVLD
jgi:hypothetical protein